MTLKVIEKLLLLKIETYIKTRKEQYAFCTNFLTTTQLIKMDDLAINKSYNTHTAALFLNGESIEIATGYDRKASFRNVLKRHTTEPMVFSILLGHFFLVNVI